MSVFNKKTIKGIKLAGKRVLMRADFNVPLVDGSVSEAYRISQALPTIHYLLDQDCAGLVIVSHLGRPNGHYDKNYSLKPVAEKLSKLLGKPVQFANDCVGDEAKKLASTLKAGQVLLLENLRFHPGEEANDKEFAKLLVSSSVAEVFVQDGFGVVHRKHATTDAITRLLPSVSGLLLEKEVTSISAAMHNPARPLTAVIGGAKISDKLELLEKFIDLADCVAVAGAMATNFWVAEGAAVGKSLTEPDLIEQTKAIIARARSAERNRNFNFLIPKDAVVSSSIDGDKPTRVVDMSYTLSDIEAYPKLPLSQSHTVGAAEMILDIGPISAARIAGAIEMSQTVVWNGTCGVTETNGIAGAAAPFSHGTRMVVEAITGTSRHHKNKPFSLAGGGDTVSYIEQNKLLDDIGFISTGGGASLELMVGHKLPGIEALQAK